MASDGQTVWVNNQPFDWIDVGVRTDDESFWVKSKPVEQLFTQAAPPVEGGGDDILYNTL